ncbi:MAG: prepilin-type N-terminal cleavage/methylation domain-containing protein [Patescibacteria group bacterium]
MSAPNKKFGFTLFEIIVAMGVFSMAISIILSAMLSMTDAQRKAITLQSAEDNLRFAIEALSREMRTGHGYDCNVTGTPNNCSQGAPRMAFVSAKGVGVIYRWNGIDYAIEKSVDNGITYYPITSTDIKIEMLRFYIFGAGGVGTDGVGEQPRVLISIRATAQDLKSKTQSQFNIQTTIAQRELDS